VGDVSCMSIGGSIGPRRRSAGGRIRLKRDLSSSHGGFYVNKDEY